MLEVLDQGVSKADSSEASLLGWEMASLLSLAVVFPLCVWVRIASSYENIDQTALHLPWWLHLTLITSLKTLSLNAVTLWGTGDWDQKKGILGRHSSAHDINWPQLLFKLFSISFLRKPPWSISPEFFIYCLCSQNTNHTEQKILLSGGYLSC